MTMGFCPKAQKVDRETGLNKPQGLPRDASEMTFGERRWPEEIDSVSQSSLAKAVRYLAESTFRDEQNEQQPERQQRQPRGHLSAPAKR
jgi:hypothetical protein